MKNIILFLFFLPFCIFAEDLLNPNLDAAPDGSLPGWTVYRTENPFRLDTSVLLTGKTSVAGTSVRDGEHFGLKQEVVYEKPDKTPIIFGGWSKAQNVISGGEFCIYLDIFYEDGSNDWGKKADWSIGTHDWEYTVNIVYPIKPVSKIQYFVLLRKTDGTVWLDDFSLERKKPGVQTGPVRILNSTPYRQNGLTVQAKFFKNNITYSCKIVDEQQKVLASIDGKGRTISWLTPELDGVPKTLIITSSDGVETATRSIIIPQKAKEFLSPVKSGSFKVWCADSMTNISPIHFPKGNEPGNISLELAKGERESAQILVTTARDLELNNVTLTPTKLQSKEGTVFKGNVKLERVAYLSRTDPSQHPNGYPENLTWLPDPLLPYAPFSVPPNATQGIWLTVFAAPDAQAGTYSGSIILAVKGHKDVEIPVTIKVFNFQLPKYFSYKTAICVMDGHLFSVYNDDKDARRRQIWDIMLDHRLNPDDISRYELPQIKDLLYARERGMNSFNILNLVPYPKDKPIWLCYSNPEAYTPELIEEFKKRLDPFVAELRKHDLTKLAYVYGFDERTDEYYKIMADIHAFIKNRYPDVAFMTTSAMYKSLLAKPDRTDCYANDWYCPTTRAYSPELSDKLRAKGHKVWWYTCCSPQYPYANFASLEYPFIEGRLLAWMSYQFKADGFLFWHANLWLNGTKPFDESTTYQPEFKTSLVMRMTGDGQFIYPGKNGPVPSIRLANLRDGSEDYDYFTLLADKIGPDEVRKLCAQLSKSRTDFTRDPSKLRTLRSKIAAMIE